MTRAMRFSFIAFYIIVGFLIYSNVILNGEFLFDDFEYVVGNPLIQSFYYSDLSDPRQIGYLSFALNHAVWGQNAQAYHFVNVGIHVINALLVFLFIRLILNVINPEIGSEKWRIAAGFLAGLIFLVHPVQTQAVSYITQRFTSLCTLFYILSVLFYLMARVNLEKDSGSFQGYLLYGISILSSFLAMKTKEIAFTIPFTIAFFEFFLFSGSVYQRRRFIYLIPLFAMLVIIPLSLIGPEWGLIKPAEGIAEVVRKDKLYDLTERSPFDYFFTQLRVIVVYMRLLFLPVKQRVVYDFKPSHSLFELKVILSLLFLLVVAGLAIYFWRKARSAEPRDAAEYKLASLGIIWFFLTISVESSIIPIKDLIFEHRVYLPSVGLIGGVSGLMVQAVRKLFPSVRNFYKFAALAGVICSVFAVSSYIRNDVWTDELKFWDDVVKKSPEKAIGYNNRGNAYAKIGKYDLALRDIDKTISQFSRSKDRLAWENADFTPTNMAKTYMNRGQIYYYLGDKEKADADFSRAKQVMFMPYMDIAGTMKIAVLYYEKGAYGHAIEEYNKILGWEPDNIDALNNRGNAYSKSNRFPEAIEDFNKVISMRPDFLLAYHNRGIAYAWLGDKKKAVEDFRKACKMGFKPACDSIELVEGETGKGDKKQE